MTIGKLDSIDTSLFAQLQGVTTPPNFVKIGNHIIVDANRIAVIQKHNDNVIYIVVDGVKHTADAKFESKIERDTCFDATCAILVKVDAGQ